jgi:DNA-binding transcriptional regulator YiaG
MISGEFRQIRAYLHMSPQVLALKLNVGTTTIRCWETGTEPVPNLIALVMNVLLRQGRARRRDS